MLVLRRHAESIGDLDSKEWDELHSLISRTTRALTAEFTPDHFNYVFLQNQDRHVHLHVIPRYHRPVVRDGRTFVDEGWPGHYEVGEEVRLEQQNLLTLAALLGARW